MQNGFQTSHLHFVLICYSYVVKPPIVRYFTLLGMALRFPRRATRFLKLKLTKLAPYTSHKASNLKNNKRWCSLTG